MALLKPILIVKDDIPVFVWFCEEFCSIHKVIQKKEGPDDTGEGPSDKDNILEIMFLHLTLECTVTFYLRQLFHFFESGALRKIWNRKEEETFSRKLDFIEDISSNTEDLKNFMSFARKSNRYRNWIVHGHEFSSEWGTNHFKESRLSEIISHYDSGDYVKEFEVCIKAFFKVGKKVAFINIDEKRLQNFIDTADSIERNFNETFLRHQ